MKIMKWNSFFPPQLSFYLLTIRNEMLSNENMFFLELRPSTFGVTEMSPADSIQYSAVGGGGYPALEMSSTEDKRSRRKKLPFCFSLLSET